MAMIAKRVKLCGKKAHTKSAMTHKIHTDRVYVVTEIHFGGFFVLVCVYKCNFVGQKSYGFIY